MSKQLLASVATIIYRHKDGAKQFLIAKRKSGPYKGFYCFPGGKIDQTDKDIFFAAERETYEETGLVIKVKQEIIHSQIHEGFFCCYVAAPYNSIKNPINKEPEKHGKWDWYSVEEIISLGAGPLIPVFVLEDL